MKSSQSYPRRANRPVAASRNGNVRQAIPYLEIDFTCRSTRVIARIPIKSVQPTQEEYPSAGRSNHWRMIRIPTNRPGQILQSG